MTRDDLARLLAAAVRRGAMTERERAEILAAVDAGLVSIDDVLAEIGSDDERALAGPVLVALAFALAVRRRLPSARYRPTVRRFVTARGQVLTPDVVRQAVDVVLDRAEAQIVDAGRALRERRISMRAFYETMEQRILERHVAMAAAARGGLAQLTDADRVWIRDRVLEQFAYLDGLADDVLSGRQPLDGRLAARLRQYAQAPRATYEAMRGRVAEAQGMTEERRIRFAGDSCRASVRPGCIEEAAKSWGPIGHTVPVGQCTCLMNCRCVKRYRRGGDA